MFELVKVNYHDLLEVNHDGYIISEEDAKYLIECQKDILEHTDRIIINNDILKSIILTFRNNSYENVVDISIKILDIFFQMKNNTNDLINDHDLVNILFDIYENYAYGTIELMDDYLDQIIEYVNIHHHLEGFKYVRYG